MHRVLGVTGTVVLRGSWQPLLTPPPPPVSLSLSLVQSSQRLRKENGFGSASEKDSILCEDVRKGKKNVGKIL